MLLHTSVGMYTGFFPRGEGGGGGGGWWPIWIYFSQGLADVEGVI